MPMGSWLGNNQQEQQEQPMQPMGQGMIPPPQARPMQPMAPGALGQSPQAVTSPLQQLTQLVMQHEGLEPLQTPIRITNPKMKKWTSMYDDTIKVKLNPNAKKGKGRQNFLYLQNQEDLVPLIAEQFRRYNENPAKYGLPENPTISQAIRVFDQTGAQGKIDFIQKMGVSPDAPLNTLFRMQNQQGATGSQYVPADPASMSTTGVRG